MEDLSSRFNIDFQSRMIAIAATQPFFLNLYFDVFKPSLFTSQYHRDFCSWIGSFYERYKVLPSKTVLLKILREKVQKDAPLYKGYRSLLDYIYEVEVSDYEYIKDQVVLAAKHQSLKAALIKMVDQVDAGQFDLLSSTLNEALKIGSGAGDIGLNLRTSSVEAILKFGLLEQPVLTGFKELERGVGGFYDGELTVVVAPPNQGKTAYLGNLAYGASRYDQTVMYYTLEIGDMRMLNRFYAKMSNLKTNELYGNMPAVKDALKRYSLTTGGTIYVKYFPASSISVETLKSHLAMINGNGIHPKLIVVDYADKIRPSNMKDPPPDRVKQVYTDLRTLGAEFNAHIMTASQSRRSTLYASKIDLDDLAESWGKAQEADTIAAVCQTMEEKVAGVSRLYLAKTRNETSGRFVHTSNDYSILSIKEIDKKTYSRKMTRMGFKVPDDRPKALRMLKKNPDKELEDRYD